MIALDTNILLYALDGREPQKKAIAHDLVLHAMLEGWIVPAQASAELLAVVKRKRPDLAADGHTLVKALSQSTACPPTTVEDAADAFTQAQRHRLQYFDALILTVAARAGATTLYSEDMQAGLAVGPLTVRNPFKPSSRTA